MHQIDPVEVLSRLKENLAEDQDRLRLLSLLFIQLLDFIKAPIELILEALSLFSIVTIPDVLCRLLQDLEERPCDAAQDCRQGDDDRVSPH